MLTYQPKVLIFIGALVLNIILLCLITQYDFKLHGSPSSTATSLVAQETDQKLDKKLDGQEKLIIEIANLQSQLNKSFENIEKLILVSKLEIESSTNNFIKESIQKQDDVRKKNWDERHSVLPYAGNHQTIRLPSDSATVYFVYDYDKIQPRAWCSIESLCRLKVAVTLITNDPSIFKSLSGDCDLKFIDLNYEDLYRDTPFFDWYKNTDFKKHEYEKIDKADAIRLAIIYKNGGVYSDLDIIFFSKDFLTTKNKIAAQLRIGNL